MYLFDTNIISELRKHPSGKANKNVVDWCAKIPLEMQYVSVITILEIEMGAIAKQRKDPRQGSILLQWLHNMVIPAFEGRILAINLDISLRCAQLHVPDKQPERDAFIAVTALVNNLTLVTRNVADFKSTVDLLINPWDKESEQLAEF